MLTLRTIWPSMLALSLAGCVDGAGADPEIDVSEIAATAPSVLQAPAPAPCATPRVEMWTGTAGRINEHYPDNVATTVTWTRVSSSGCVDRYAPSGTARYAYAVPGALCDQTLDPIDHAITAADGTLEIDRSTSPATYTGQGSTVWTVTWTCHLDSGDETQTFPGGGSWFAASGTIGAGVEGARTVDDGRQCGRGQSSLPCEYTWRFDPTAP